MIETMGRANVYIYTSSSHYGAHVEGKVSVFSHKELTVLFFLLMFLYFTSSFLMSLQSQSGHGYQIYHQAQFDLYDHQILRPCQDGTSPL